MFSVSMEIKSESMRSCDKQEVVALKVDGEIFIETGSSHVCANGTSCEVKTEGWKSISDLKANFSEVFTRN